MDKLVKRIIGGSIATMGAGAATALAARTAKFSPSKEEPRNPQPVTVDMDALVDTFSSLIRCKTVSYYDHTLEGLDDMPAHAKSTLAGVSITIPISRGRLNLGTWQGIYLCEFRDHGGPRSIVATIIGE